MGYVETRTRTFTNGASALARCLRVKLNSGTLTTAGVGDVSLGTLRSRAEADGAAAVVLRNAEGTVQMVASGAISAGADVFAAASGKIAATGFVYEGIALEAATADGDIIEVLPCPAQTANIQTVAAAGSAQGDAAALTGPVNVVTGADGTKGVVLPSAVAGLRVEVFSSAATNGLKVYPATDDKINEGSADAAVTIEGKTHAVFVATAADNWAATFTANT